MPKPPITSFSSVSVNSDYVTGNNYGLYVPQLTSTQRDSIPNNVLKNGALMYNITSNHLQSRINDAWVDIYGGVPPADYVIRTGNTVDNNLAIWDGNNNNHIQDSGVALARVATTTANGTENMIATFTGNGGELQDSNVIITRVPPIAVAALNRPHLLNVTTVNQIGNLGHIKFITEVGSVYVDGLTALDFVSNTHDSDTQVNTIFTGDLPSGGSSSYSALVELKSTTGALLLSRLDTTHRNALVAPQSGMLLYNTTTDTFEGYVNGNWKLLSGGGTVTSITAGAGLTGGAITTSGTIAIANTGVTAGSYTYGTFTVNAQGQLTSASNGTPPVTSITAGTGINITGTTTPTINLANTAVTPSSYTAANITVDAQGRITSASNGGGSFGDVTGPATSVNNNLVLFNGTTGKLIKDSSIDISNVYYAGHPTYLIDTSGSTNNFFAGTNAGNNTTIDGTNNTGIGIMALSANTIGFSNTALGTQALYSNISGTINTAVGFQSMYSNSVGVGNTAVGAYALNNGGSSNTAVGFNSLASLVYFDTFIPQRNVAIGYYSGYDYGLLENCTFVGAYADALANVTNASAIGYNAKVGVSNAIVLGAGCNIGIGKNSPTYALQIGTDNSTTPLLYMASTSIPATPATSNDGVYSVNAGKPIFTSGTTKYQGTLTTAITTGGSPTAGRGSHSGSSPTTISTGAVNSNSLIFIQAIGTINYNITSVVGNIIDNTSFDVQFNLASAIDFYWFIINPS